jgi:tRNA-dihydrouridine synthase B
MRLGSFVFEHPVFAAPMAGISDRPYRNLCRAHGAALAFSEMVSSRPEHRNTFETRMRLNHSGEPGPVAVQIVGTDPLQLAEMARHGANNGARIIDINMGCPSKKVCNQLAGSALLADEALVRRIVTAVVRSVNIPVTLKIRTGLSTVSRNAVSVAQIAEDAGVQMLTIHGRTRQCRFKGPVEYDTIARVKKAVAIPVVANGDIDCPEKAREVLEYTGADAVMVGRWAQGRPWLFGQISHYLATGEKQPDPSVEEKVSVMLDHLDMMYEFYGREYGAVLSRKHIASYLNGIPGSGELRRRVNRLESAALQSRLLRQHFNQPLAPLTLAA